MPYAELKSSPFSRSLKSSYGMGAGTLIPSYAAAVYYAETASMRMRMHLSE